MSTREFHRRGTVEVVLLLGCATALDAQTLPRVPPEDYAKWEELGGTELSPDGKWLTVRIERVDMDGELQIYELSTREDPIIIPNATNPRFSADGRWLALSIGHGEAEREARQKAGQPVRNRLGLIDLETWQRTEVPEVSASAFVADGRFIAMRSYPPSGSTTFDLVVRDLSTGEDTPLGNVVSYALQEGGSLIALVVDAQVDGGDGVQLYDAATGSVRMLENDTAEYHPPVWRAGSDDLAILKTHRDSSHAEAAHVVVAWRNLEEGIVPQVFDPAAMAGFPQDMRIVESRPLEWSNDGAKLFFGVAAWPRRQNERTAEPARRADVDVWHPLDIELIAEQKLQAERDRRRSDLAVWHLDEDRFVRLNDGTFEEVRLFEDQRHVLGLDETPWAFERRFGPPLRDLYVIDVGTGRREKIAERVEFEYGASPDGRYVLYLLDDHYRVYDVARGTHTNITESLPVPVVNIEHDQAVEQRPPFGMGGWSPGDRSVLLYSRYDIWEVRADGASHTKLTNGEADRVRSRLVWLDPTHRVRDLDGAEYVALYGERSKKYGYARLHRDHVDTLVWRDANVSRFLKARDADVHAWREEAFDDSPDWFVGGSGIPARQVTHTNPFQAEYAWGRAELLSFRNVLGVDLQAGLLYPADYEAGRTYPMIVYIYESTSSLMHGYHAPSDREVYNPTVWTQEGYFVLRPDIAYRQRNPGFSAVESLVPAVQRAIATGMIDPARIGLIGESWGGYQSVFVPTQTDMFAAAVAGAPITEMAAMHLSVFWNLGVPNARIFETGQGRMVVPPWQDPDSYIANSPVHHIEKLNTPVLIAFGTRDGAVEWQQGLFMYNAARRAGKQVVLLAYEGENHGIAREPNQIDYHNRILEWFGHYLKGEPAAPWITEGVPFLERDHEVRPGRPVSTRSGGEDD